MYRTYVECEGRAPRRDQIPKPCDHFDLIAGTGTGGLIAIMLGRLRLDLETCKEVYVRMTRRVFETDKTIAGIPYRSTLFKASKLEEAIRECVREHTVFESEGNDQPNASSNPRASMASLPYAAPNSVPQRSVSRGSFSTSPMSHPQSPASQRGSTFLNGLRWGNPDALLYDNREFRTKTYVFLSESVIRIYNANKQSAPSLRYTRALSATGQPYFCAPTTLAENPHPSLTAPSGRLAVPHQPRDSPSSRFKLASMCLSTKDPEPTTLRPRFSRKQLPTSGLVEKSACSSVLELVDGPLAPTLDSMNGGRISLDPRPGHSPRHDDD